MSADQAPANLPVAELVVEDAEGPTGRDDAEQDDGEDDYSQASENALIPAPDPLLPAIMGPDDPLRMKLTRQEHAWAWDIKDCIEMLPDLDNLCDFWYAQLAIVCQDNVEDAVRRAYGLQHFREEFKIRDSAEHGRHCFKQTVYELSPKQLLSFSFSYSDGSYVLIHDITKLDTTRVSTPQKWDDYLGFCYYLHAIWGPDFASIRKGCICCIEWDGWDWKKKQDGKLILRYFSRLLTIYPFRGKCKNYHTGMFANLMLSAFRNISPFLRDIFVTGLQFDGRLDDFFMVPSLEVSNQRLLNRMEATLKLRYQNERTFTLSEEYIPIL